MRQGLLPQAERIYFWAALALMGAALVFRLAFLAFQSTLDLAPDEAHYWEWSRRLDWSYYSKGPMVAWVIWLSQALLGDFSLWIRGDLAFAVRAPAVLFGTGFLASLFTFTRDVLKSDRWAFFAVVIALSLPGLSLGSLLMTIDPPFLCFWGWALVFTYHAIFYDRVWAWAAAGGCVALGLLSKHTMVLFVPCVGLFLISTRSYRPLLWSAGFWCLTLLGALGSVPILAWNLHHDWVTFRHTAGHAGLATHSGIQWLGPLRYLGGQLAVLVGFWFVTWAWAAWKYRPGQPRDASLHFTWCLSVPIVVFFGFFSLKNGGGEPNWPLPAYASGLVLLLVAMRETLETAPDLGRRLRTFATAFVLVGIALTVVALNMDALHPALAPWAGEPTTLRPHPLRRFDPTTRLRGWAQLGGAVRQTVAQLRQQGEDPILVGTNYSIASELAFHTGLEVYSLGRVFGDRHTQYDLWRPNPVADPGKFLGRTFLIVDTGEPDLIPYFDDMDVTTRVDHAPQGYPLAGWKLHTCRGFRGYDNTYHHPEKY